MSKKDKTEEKKHEGGEKQESKTEAKVDVKKWNGFSWNTIVILVAVAVGTYYIASHQGGGTIVSVGEGAVSISKVETVNADDIAQWSYAVGSLFGDQLAFGLDQANEAQEVDRAIAVAAITDVILKKEDLPMTQEQVEEILTVVEQRAIEKNQQQAQENLEEGEEYRADYETQEGVTKLASGVLYKVLQEGAGEVVGTQTANVTYSGKLIDGTVFDNNIGQEPAPFSSDLVVPGFGEALELMRVGDKWEVVIPSDLAYGEQGTPAIPANATLIFEIEVKEIAPQGSTEETAGGQ